MSSKPFFATLALTLAAASAARAESPVPPPPPGLTLPAGRLNVAVNLELEMSKGRVGEPVSISPDLSYGVTSDLTVALVHSRVALTGFRAAVGGGLCLTGTDGGCVAVYNNVGAEAWFNVARGRNAAALGGGVHALNLDAGFYGAKLGARFRHTHGKVAVHAQPSVIVAVTEREDNGAGRLNRDTLWVPIQLTYKGTPALTCGLGSGVKGALDNFGDAWQVPLGFMATYAIDPDTTAGASWVFGQVLAGTDDGFDQRGLQLWVNRLF